MGDLQDELAQETKMAQYFVQVAARVVCSLECMSCLLIVNIILKSRMNREVHVRFCEEQGVNPPLLTRLAVCCISRQFLSFSTWAAQNTFATYLLILL